MFEEDAVTRMEELGHSFFVFVNAEDERIAILDRRSEGDYGLIEPCPRQQYVRFGASSEERGIRVALQVSTKSSIRRICSARLSL